MRRPEHDIARGLSLQMRSFDRRVRHHHAEGSDWIWTVPVLSSLGTLAIFMSIAQLSGVGFAVSVPIGIIAALVMAGMSIVYMTPGDWTESDGDEDTRRQQHATPDQRIHRAGSLPPSAWMTVNTEDDLDPQRERVGSREHAGRPR
jgi:hypothetical protein